MISVIVITKNRPQKIRQCIDSIFRSTYKNFEIVIVDQSDRNYIFDIHTYQRKHNFKYIKDSQTGKTRGSNIALQIAKGNILSFIDDDNLVSSQWLNNISHYLNSNPSCQVLFGKILPYQPNKHKGMISPACFLKKGKCIIRSTNVLFHKSVGLGSNMTIKKDIFIKYGGFKEWLGPGAYGFSGGEDGEFITRLLTQKIDLHYNSKIIVYHNRWLNKEEYDQLLTKYTGGEIAYAIYFLVKGYKYYGKLAFRIISKRIYVKKEYIKIFTSLKSLHYREFISELYTQMDISFRMIYFSLKGIIVGIYFALYEHIYEKYRI